MEQAAHFIKPIVEKIVSSYDDKPEIKLIQSNKKGNYAKELMSVLSQKDHDIFASIVKDEKEFPLFFLEVSFAVPTRDHILQRFDALSATSIAGYPYVKITSSEKISSSEHGGEINFDPLTAYNLIQDSLPGSVIAEFDIPIYDREDDNAPYLLQHKFENGFGYMACPGEKDKNGTEFEFYKNFTNFIDTCIKCAYDVDKPENYQKKLDEKLKEQEWYKAFLQDISKANIDDPKTFKSRRFYMEVSPEHIVHKLNRFGHSMDPSRGMMVYFEMLSAKYKLQPQELRMWFDKEKTAWYTAGAGERKIRAHVANSGLKSSYDFLYCFCQTLYGDVKIAFENDIMSKVNKKQKACITINLDPFLQQNFDKIEALHYRLLFSCSNKLKLQYVKYKKNKKGEPSGTPDCTEKSPYKLDSQNKVVFNYTKQKLRTITKGGNNITPISDPKETEDDLTYIIANCIIQQEFKHGIYSVSYPGDQGAEPMLAKDEMGRAQPRRNPDIFVQFKTQSGENDKKGVLLVENKEKFSKSDIKEDIDKIEKFQEEESIEYKALDVSLQMKKLTKDNPNGNPPIKPKVLLAVGFFKGSTYTREKLEECTIDSMTNKHAIDYAFVISSDTKTWEIVELGSNGDFAKLTGSYSMPEHFAVEKTRIIN